LPDVDEELEEIKRLIDFDGAGSPPVSDGLDLLIPEPGNEATRAAPVSEAPAPGIGLSGPPAVVRRPMAPQARRLPVAPDTVQPARPPAGPRETGLVRARQEGAELIQRERPLPAQPRRSEPPALRESRRELSLSEVRPVEDDEEQMDEEPDVGSEDFKVKFDFDGAYKDVPENRPLRFRREKRTGCIGGFMYAAFVICVSIILASLMWMATVDVMGFGQENEQVNITVQPDFTIDDITEMLYDNGLIKYKFLFNFYAGFSNAEEKIKAGAYVLNKNYDYRAIVQGMTARAGVRVETRVVIPEGFSLSQIFTLLEDYGVCPAADLWEAATNYDFKYSFLDKETLGNKVRLEGFLFPDTYNFYLDSSPVLAINKFLYEFDRRFTETYTDRAEDMGLSIQEIIIVASMIEREAGSDEERPRIAAVIYNRLASKDFPHLQIDATIVYAQAGTGIPFSIDYDHPYNTYICEGLPPGPIANPGMNSIRAALYPDTTNEYYYALNTEGTHNFFRTRAQHEAFVKSPQYGGN